MTAVELMSWSVREPLPLSSPAPRVAATPASSSRRPELTESVITTAALPASGSATDRPLTTMSASSARVSAPGTVLTGGSLTAPTVMGIAPPAWSGPPLPVAPWSSAARLMVTGPLKPEGGR